MKRLVSIFLLFFIFISKSYGISTQKLTVLLDWFPNPNHAPLFVAQAQGFFQEEGLEVELLGPADPADPPKLVAANKADIGISYEPHWVQHIQQGLPLARIGTLIDQPLNALLVLKNGPIKTLADLKGKRIGYSSGDTNSLMLSVMLKNNGVSLQDVELINVHYDLVQGLLSKKVDAVIGIMRNFEPIQIGLLGQPARLFLPEKNNVPSYSELIFIVNKKNIHDPRYTRFLIAVKKGLNYLRQHPTETWAQFAKSHPELNNELNRRAWMETLSYFSNDPSKV